MKGCRPLTDEEYKLVLSHLYSTRDKCLFVVGCRTGLRISELLSVKLSSLTSTTLSVERCSTKGKIEGATIVLHPEAIEALQLWLASRKDDSPYLFPSSAGGNLKRLRGYRILQRAYSEAGLEGPLATHTMRKTFAARIYKHVDKDIMITAKALRHKSVASTMSYIGVNQAIVDNAILAT